VGCGCGLQHHWAVRVRYSSHRSTDSSSDGRQYQEHHVRRVAVRRPHPRPLPRHLPRPPGRRTRPRRTALLKTTVSLPVAGDNDPLDQTQREDRLIDTNHLQDINHIYGHEISTIVMHEVV